MNDKTIKRELRKMGVAHSDAAAFIRVYKKIRQKGKGRMVQDIMGPMLPAGVANLVLGHSRKVERVFAEHYAPREWLGQIQNDGLEGRFRLEIARRLAGELVSGDVVVWSRRMEMKGGQICYVLRGSLDVVMPAEKPRAVKHKSYAEGTCDKVTLMKPWGDD